MTEPGGMTGSLRALTRVSRTPEAPVLVLLHGTGGSEQDLLPLADLLLPDASVIAPRGPVVEQDGVPRFFRRIPTGESGPYPFTFDPDEIALRVEDMAAFLDEQAALHDLVGRPRIAVGFSNGANLATSLLMLRPDTLAAVIAFAPMPVLTNPPSRPLDAAGAWLGGGRQDPIAPPTAVEDVAAQLTERGAAVEVTFGGGGHAITPDLVRAATAWLTKLTFATGGMGPP